MVVCPDGEQRVGYGACAVPILEYPDIKKRGRGFEQEKAEAQETRPCFA